MRVNTPVTQREYEFPDNATLMSTTDTQSHITYANAAFVAVSGFSLEEIQAQPHNLVRHPDMPKEAFADMWATLKGGEPWTALVKNRRKNGDHYWVLANATPIVENGQAVGYMSVRTKPTREQISAAESLYARLRAEAESGHPAIALHRGQVVHTGWRGRLQRWTRPTLGRKIAACAVALSFGVQFLEHFTEGMPEWVHVAAFGVTALIALGVAAFMRNMMTGPLEAAGAFANRMAAGDLTARLDARQGGEFGELYRALNQLNVNLQAVVSDVRTEVEGVQVASSEIASGNHDLSSRTEAQASSLEQTAASMDQINSTVQQSSLSAQEAARLASQAVTVAQQSNQAVGQLIGTMDEITRSSKRISEIIQVIDGISFQTNILALNAAVEAARAGEQGRGFAVVAGEVRNLAQRTLTAAKEIKALIDESSSKVERGSEQVNAAGSTIGGMAQTVAQVNALISEITHASQEQSLGIGQINQAVSHMDSVTQQNSAMVEELAAAASSLQNQAKVLESSVSIFRL